MGWYSRSKKVTRKLYRKPSRIARKYGNKARRFNRKHKGVGLTPDYVISPIDATPLGFYNKGRKIRRAVSTVKKTTKAGYRASQSRRKAAQSSPKGRKKRRGNFYYYRGKRVYRK